MSDVEKAKALFFEALSFMDASNFPAAEQRLREALPHSPGSASILTNLALVLHRQHKDAEATELAEKAVAAKADNIEALLVLGDCYAKGEKLNEALDCYQKSLALDRNIPEACNNSGIILEKLKRPAEALAAFERAIALIPNHPDFQVNRGNALRTLKRADEALLAYDKALQLNPAFAEAWLGRGNVFSDLKRNDDALAAYEKALAFKPNSDAWLGRGKVFADLKRHDEALAAYDSALALNPGLAEAQFGRGNVFSDLKRFDEALAAYEKALALKPAMAEALLGRGNVFFDRRGYGEALEIYDKALALSPDLAEAWLGRGNVLFELNRYNEAVAAYDKALAQNPSLAGAQGARRHSKAHSCNWQDFDSETEHLVSAVRAKKTIVQPFQFVALSSSPEAHLQCARLWVEQRCPASNRPLWQGEQYQHDRIRVAYLSADFYDHATAHLMAGVFESHDKSRFEVFAISWGRDDNSDMAKRLRASFEHFIDVRQQSDDQVAELMKRSEIDILIDLKGFTHESRPGIFSRRPAPIQISYLGFPSTMGAEYIDYIMADRIVIPESFYQCYAEKAVLLPNSYYPTSYGMNEARRSAPTKAFTRAELGLPPNSFVFCCFNNNYKITPHVFDAWMRILKAVDGSVLWLLEDNPVAAANLRKEADARGVKSERLVFAGRMPIPEHLARHRLADLFLDTLPYNAHTTASDALWAGLPVLTRMGESFASRVAASLLKAVDLSELIAPTPEAYEAMAIDLATHPEKLAALKAKLAKNRDTAPLFDTQMLTRHMEAAYAAAHRRHQDGLAPDRIAVAD